MYKVSFYLCWPLYSRNFVNKLGYSFSSISKKEPNDSNNSKEGIYSNILKEGTGIINLDLNQLSNRDWHKIQFIYTAKGGEQFLTLGVFENTITKKEYKTSINKSYVSSKIITVSNYYFIDNISIIELSTTESNTLGR